MCDKNLKKISAVQLKSIKCKNQEKANNSVSYLYEVSKKLCRKTTLLSQQVKFTQQNTSNGLQ